MQKKSANFTPIQFLRAKILFVNFPINSEEKKEYQIVVLKLQRFNNTVEKIILNKKNNFIQF
jgi:hypothetical protein